MTTAPVVMIDDEIVAELEMLASKATPGPWWIDSHGHTMMSMGSHEVVFMHPSDGNAVRHEETGNLSHWRNDWDASYIAAANPAVIRAILAERASLLADAARYHFIKDACEVSHMGQQVESTSHLDFLMSR